MNVAVHEVVFHIWIVTHLLKSAVEPEPFVSTERMRGEKKYLLHPRIISILTHNRYTSTLPADKFFRLPVLMGVVAKLFMLPDVELGLEPPA